MKINYLKITLALVCSLAIFSCSKDEESINTENEVFEKTTFSTSSIYYDVLNSDNPQESYDALSNEDKAIVWQTKYEIFTNKTELTINQRDALNLLSTFTYNAQLQQDYDIQESNSINSELINTGFSTGQIISLLFHIDNPTIPGEPGYTTDCFWCNEITEEGPCHAEEYNGHYHLVKNIEYKKVRGFITISSGHTGQIPCSDDEIDEWLNNN